MKTIKLITTVSEIKENTYNILRLQSQNLTQIKSYFCLKLWGFHTKPPFSRFF